MASYKSSEVARILHQRMDVLATLERRYGFTSTLQPFQNKSLWFKQRRIRTGMMLDSISFSQKQRLAYIDFSLLFKGVIYRQDVINRFEVGLSAATRDLNIYKELAPDNLHYDARERRYFLTTLQQQLDSKANAAAQKNINLKILSQIKIPVPTLAEQKSIVKQINEIDRLAVKVKAEISEKITMMQQLKASILDSAFKGEL